MGIESVVNENKEKTSSGVHDAMCTACEMAVVWMENQIKKNQTEEQILNYVNEVNWRFCSHFWNIWPCSELKPVLALAAL
jgi:hypothetical protein